MPVTLIADDPSAYLGGSDVVDLDHPDVRAAHAELVAGAERRDEQARRVYEFVRDQVRHSLDAGDRTVTLRASDVLAQRTGLCYAKSHLAVALLRLSGIPAGLCYQLVRDGDRLVLHGLVAVHLGGAWRRLDVRGNKSGVDAHFDLEEEHLAFALDPTAGESDLPELLVEPAVAVVSCLTSGNDLRHLRLPEGLPGLDRAGRGHRTSRSSSPKATVPRRGPSFTSGAPVRTLALGANGGPRRDRGGACCRRRPGLTFPT